MNDFNLKDIMELLTPKPASISASMTSEGILKIKIEGRNIETMALLIALTEKIINESPMTTEMYCECLKNKPDPNSELRKKADSIKTFSQMFSELMKDKENGKDEN